MDTYKKEQTTTRLRPAVAGLRRGKRMTRMVHEEKLPTKHTKHANEQNLLNKAFAPFVCLVGKPILDARIPNGASSNLLHESISRCERDR
jgi:hypothetical protein